MEGKTLRSAPLTGAGPGIELGGLRFQGPGGPVTNSRVSFSPNLHPTVPSILGRKLSADRQSSG